MGKAMGVAAAMAAEMGANAGDLARRGNDETGPFMVGVRCRGEWVIDNTGP